MWRSGGGACRCWGEPNGGGAALEWGVGLVAILRGGAAYVPLDPTYPKDRLDFMLQEVQAEVLVTQTRWAEQLPAQQIRRLCLDNEWPLIAQQHADNLLLTMTGDHLAYVMFTSGSTGLPKGIAISQRSIVRLVKAADYATLAAEDVFFQLAPLAVDDSTLEIWGALLNG